MEIILPKWLCKALNEQTEHSLQNIIKKILIETINNPHEGYALLDIVKEKDAIAKYKLEIDKEKQRKV